MRNMISKAVLAVSICALPFLTGCGAFKGGLFAKTETVQEHVVTVPAATNSVAVVAPDGSTSVVEVVTPAASVTNLVTNVVYAPNPALVTTIRTIQDVNDTVNPLPFSGAISGVLTLALAGLGFWAKRKSEKASLLNTVIAGIEEAQKPEVKAAVKRIAIAVGAEGKLNKVVREVTGKN